MTNSKQKNVFMIQNLIASGQMVNIFLMNGIKLRGAIEGQHPDYLVLTKDNIPQVVYRHAIATIVPVGGFDIESAINPPPSDYCEQEQNILDQLIEEKLSVKMFMMNGICLQGNLVAQDDGELLMKNFKSCQSVMRSAIATIVPC